LKEELLEKNSWKKERDLKDPTSISKKEGLYTFEASWEAYFTLQHHPEEARRSLHHH